MMTIQTWTNTHGVDLPPGPWSDEPDKAVWVDPSTDLDCMIHRNRMGVLCGYVGVGPEHPLHGDDYDVPGVDVHGGLTYSDRCQETDDPAKGLCHVAQPGRPDDVWWFGFDCGHSGDLMPRMTELSLSDWDIYRTFEYVKAEVESLARQLVEVTR